MDEYQQLLLDAFKGFRGTIISGGTTAGISGLVGKVQTANLKTISSIGYVPGALPAGAELDPHYQLVRATEGQDFSPLEPLQYWIDLIAAGVDPAQVKLIGINGGKISAFEYRLALMLGASVGVIESSGREVARLFKDPDWSHSKTLWRLVADEKEIKTFINSEKSE